MKKFFTSILILSVLSLTISQTSRNLQKLNFDAKDYKNYKKEDDKCSLTKASNATDCWNSSADSADDNCCAIKVMNQVMCKNFKKGSEVYKSFQNFGGVEKMNVYLTTSLLGNADVSCSNQNQISEDVKTLANNCGNLKTPSVESCNAMSNSNVQCCYTNTMSKSLGNISMEACAGIVAPVNMPSYSMKNEGAQSSLYCGINSEEKNIMDSCAAAVPEKEEDCTKFSKGNAICKYASYEKSGERVKMCLGMKGDLQMMMDLGIEPRLRTVRLSGEDESFGRIGFSYLAFLMSLIVFLI